ncbi:MAG: secondary thiamine-phosphate synthase enzyme YjbQ [Chloroflexota bacterium]
MKIWPVASLSVRTPASVSFVDVTHQVQEVISSNGTWRGQCTIFVPHTTAGITLNENWDPDVVRDMTISLERIAPHLAEHRHSEGNSPSHLKTMLTGNSTTLLIEHGQLILGSWQGIYLAEFDGPRTRKLHIRLMGEVNPANSA